MRASRCWAARGGADGVHLPFDPDLIEEAVSGFHGERSVGVEGLRSKDDAMTAGELGADYVFFGEAYSRSGETHVPPLEAVAERVAWWAEMFEVPVVAFAPEMAAIPGFVRARADFIALADAAFAHPPGRCQRGEGSPFTDQECPDPVITRLGLAVMLLAAPLAAKAESVPDLAFGAYQRGNFIEAFNIATNRAVRDNDTAAMVLLAELYGNGWGIRRSEDNALKWYRLAADRGDANALFALGSSALHGRGGMAKDPAIAAGFLRKAADKGQSNAMYNLALLYLSGQGVEADQQAAGSLMKRAAEAGLSEAQHALALMYREGNGVVRSLEQFAYWLQQAARQDLPEAEVEYAIALFNGTGITRNEAEAARLFRRAAYRGNVVAQLRYARLLSVGRAVPRDEVLAAAFYINARTQGLTDDFLERHLDRLDAIQREQAETMVIKWAK